jgi:hypothetical protein
VNGSATLAQIRKVKVALAAVAGTASVLVTAVPDGGGSVW